MGPVSRPAPLPAPSPRGFGRGTSSVSARRHRVVWSGTARSSPSRPMMEPISPSVCRYASRNTALNVSAVRIARSEYSGCPPRLVRRSASHALTASSENQTVKLPRRRRLSSYSRQFVTLRFCSGMWRRRSWFSLKGKAGIPGQTEGCPATSIGPRVLPVGSLQQRDACARYRLTTEEFLSWQTQVDRDGLQGLRTTRIQEYRGRARRTSLHDARGAGPRSESGQRSQSRTAWLRGRASAYEA